MLLWRAVAHSTSTAQHWTEMPLWIGCRAFGARGTEAVQFRGVFRRLWMAEWLMKTTRCSYQMGRRFLSCGCWVLRILQQEVSRKYPTAFPSSAGETLIVCTAPGLKRLLEEKCGTLKIFVPVKFVRLYFVEHFSTITNQQALFPLINHLDLLYMPRGVWENIWHNKQRPFLLSVPLSTLCIVHNSFFCSLAFCIYFYVHKMNYEDGPLLII